MVLSLFHSALLSACFFLQPHEQAEKQAHKLLCQVNCRQYVTVMLQHVTLTQRKSSWCSTVTYRKKLWSDTTQLCGTPTAFSLNRPPFLLYQHAASGGRCCSKINSWWHYSSMTSFSAAFFCNTAITSFGISSRNIDWDVHGTWHHTHLKDMDSKIPI